MTLSLTISRTPDDIESALAPILSTFKRRDARASAYDYVVGLLGQTERKTSWQMAEAAGRLTPHAMQHLLGRQRWDAEASMPDLQKFCLRTLGAQRSALILDETGFIKKGDKSAGVQRQYSGTAGRVENCQVGVFLAYATQRGHALISRRLFMPESWSTNPTRMKSVSAPAQTAHETKIKLAIDMLSEARQNGVKAAWVLGDEVYGNSSKLRTWCMERSQPFALGVSTRHCMWIDMKQVRMGSLLKKVSGDQWARMSTGKGTKGERRFDWAIIHHANQPLYPGFETTIVARRSVTNPADVALFSVFARHKTDFREVIQAIGQRWKIEECFEGAKGEVGLDHYEVRSWHGWHRHMTLALWAYAYLVHVACRERQKKSRRISRTSR